MSSSKLRKGCVLFFTWLLLCSFTALQVDHTQLAESSKGLTKEWQDFYEKKWEKAKSINTFESYSEFYWNYSQSEHAVEATRRLKGFIRDTATRNAKGSDKNIKKGSEYPIELFSTDDIIKSFAQPGIPMSYQLLYKTKNGEQRQSRGFQDFKNYDEWRRLYSRILMQQKEAQESQITIMAWMTPLHAEAQSSIIQDTTIQFFRDPGERSKWAVFGIQVKREFIEGVLIKETATVEGVGIGILIKRESVDVYDFNSEGKSILRD